VPSSKISLSTYERLSAGGGLFDFDESELHFLEILSEFPIIRDNSEIVNLRGELDMTLDFHFITDRDSGLPLIQGSNIGRFGLKAPSRFVSPDFLSRPKGKWVQKPRIACQQISNANQEVRMKWSYIAPGFVLANSCNFLALDDAMLRISGIGGDDFLNYLLGILNSEVMNARFKLTSANNHVSNSEIGSLPIGNPNPLSGSKISKLAAEMVVSHHSRAQAELDSMVVQNFGLVEAPPRRESRQ
jgi:Alw26I/Eco31I/Esp3I family type II restriction m6 adenine DNA methyltransferase